jgi:hypothetical protein
MPVEKSRPVVQHFNISTPMTPHRVSLRTTEASRYTAKKASIPTYIAAVHHYPDGEGTGKEKKPSIAACPRHFPSGSSDCPDGEEPGVL